MLLLDETYAVNLKIIMEFKPLPLLVHLVNAYWYSKLRALDLLNMIGQGGLFGELLDIGLLKAVLEVAEAKSDDDLLLHIVRIFKSLCCDVAVAGRVVRGRTIQSLMDIAVRAFQMVCAILTYSHSIRHASTLWEEFLQLMRAEGGVLVVLVGLLEKNKSPQSVKCSAATALAECLTLCDKQERVDLLVQIDPFPALLMNLTPRKLFGATSKELPSVVRCLSILCVNHCAQLIRAINELSGLGTSRFFDLMAAYRDSDTKDKNLIRYAQVVTQKCLDSLDIQHENELVGAVKTVNLSRESDEEQEDEQYCEEVEGEEGDFEVAECDEDWNEFCDF
eukprot:gene39049-48228_t